MRTAQLSVPAVLVILVACGEVEEPFDVLDCGAIDGLLACHTFEADDPEWTSSERDGIAVLDDRDAAAGAQALRAQVSAVGGKAVRAHAIAPADRYHVRFRAKIPPEADTTGIALLHLGEASGMYLGTNVEISSGKLGIAVQSASVYEYPHPLPIDAWMCLELELVQSETGGRAVLRVDGATVVDRGGIDTRPAAPIGDLEVGISYAGAGGSVALVDDVIVASEPLPACQ
jgi:hypothetical protein